RSEGVQAGEEDVRRAGASVDEEEVRWCPDFLTMKRLRRSKGKYYSLLFLDVSIPPMTLKDFNSTPSP
ncbi:MAG: hypothetical protein L0213_09225, partial [Candidatus Dadabacteria bacterium]|nr:hypothetical protein [Candidatus Dadabacteria bacterium]